MPKKIDINADVGEGFGPYSFGNDRELMKYITSASIACGFHAGDPLIMRRTVAWAKLHGVAIGAHPGLPDRMGFGRRKMDITADEAREYVLYQIGALQAFARADNLKLQHVKPHGALWSLAATNEAVAAGLIEGIKEIDPELIFLGRPGQLSYELAKEMGLRTAIDMGADMRYRADLTVVLERDRATADPRGIALRVAKMIEEGKVDTIEGIHVGLKIDSIAVHGDTPNAIDVVVAIREVLLERKCEIAPLGSFV